MGVPMRRGILILILGVLMVAPTVAQQGDGAGSPWGYGTKTITTVTAKSMPFNAANQTVTLEALVTDTRVVQGGTFTFSVFTNTGTLVGTPVTSGTVVNGAGQAVYTLPGGTPQQILLVVAGFSGAPGFAASYGVATLTITAPEPVALPTTTTVSSLAIPQSAVERTVTLNANLATDPVRTISEGTVTFTLTDAGSAVIGTPVSAAVVDNRATGSYVVPEGLPVQTLTITAVFDGTANFLTSTGTGLLTIESVPMFLSPLRLPYGVVRQPYSQALTCNGTTPASTSVTGDLPPGLTLSDTGILSGIPTAAGAYTFTATLTDAMGSSGSHVYVLHIEDPKPLVVGSGSGATAEVKTFEANGTVPPGAASDFVAYDPSFLGGVRVAIGDVNGDGILDRITAAGPTGTPHVEVFDGGTATVLASFLAFADMTPGGLYVASGDVDNDGRADIVVGRGSGDSQIRVFSGRTGAVIRDFDAFGPAEPDGVRVGVADVNGDGFADIIAGAGPGAPPTVQVFNGATLAVLATFDAYAGWIGDGIYVAGGDVNGDGFGDIITGAGAGGGPHVRVFDGVTFTELASFFAFDPAFPGGVRVAAADLNGDRQAEIITGMGPGGQPSVRVFDLEAGMLGDFLAYDAAFTGGVYVAGVTPMPRMAVDIPARDSTVSGTFLIAGWAFDPAACDCVGADAIHVWAYPVAGGAPVFVGTGELGGDRPDVAAAFGTRFEYSGFHLTGTLPSGVYDLVVYVHNSVSGTFNNRRVVRVTVQ
jgi:hypothetical protein